MAVPNYVKFQRGTITSYNNLRSKDSNTLYFVYENNDDSKGKLYLGTRLISGAVGEGTATSLSELTDVITTGANTGSFLVLNSEGKWTAVAAADVAEAIMSSGGNFVSVDENEFGFHSVSGKLQIKGYDTAANGMMPVKSNSGIIWQAAPTDLSSRVGTLESDVQSLQTNFQSIDGKIANAIAQASHLTYQVINNLNEATESNVVYLIANNSGEMNDVYSEYMLVNGSLEKIGSMSVDLSDYVQVGDLSSYIQQEITGKADAADLTALDTRVGTLETKVSNLENTLSNLDNDYVTQTQFSSVVGDMSSLMSYNELGSDASISDTLIDIYERLMWVDIGA